MKSRIFLSFLFASLFNISNAQDFEKAIWIEGGLSDFNVIDFDNDGDLDIVGIDYKVSSQSLVFYENSSVDSIVLVENIIMDFDDLSGRSKVIDFDDDGDYDIVFAKGDNRRLHVLINNGNNEYELKPLDIYGLPIFKITDFDGDGLLDIAGYNFNSKKFRMYNGKEDGTYEDFFTNGEFESVITDFDIGDFDGDGDIDIVIGFDKFFGKQMLYYRNDGLNYFSNKHTVNDDIQYLRKVEFNDFDNDGELDICVLTKNKFFVLHSSNGFTLSEKYVMNSTGEGDNSEFCFSDLNGDGKTDFIIGRSYGPINWFKNTSDSELSFSKSEIGSYTPIYSLNSFDFDQDGSNDIIINNGDFRLLKNNLEQIPSSTLELSTNVFKVYPNPATTNIILEKKSNEIASAIIYNFLGEQIDVIELRSPQTILDINGLIPGIYSLYVKTKESSSILQFVKL